MYAQQEFAKKKPCFLLLRNVHTVSPKTAPTSDAVYSTYRQPILILLAEMSAYLYASSRYRRLDYNAIIAINLPSLTKIQGGPKVGPQTLDRNSVKS